MGVETPPVRPVVAGVTLGADDVEAVPETGRKRVARVRTPVDWGRMPLPRGVLAAARRQGYGKVR